MLLAPDRSGEIEKTIALSRQLPIYTSHEIRDLNISRKPTPPHPLENTQPTPLLKGWRPARIRILQPLQNAEKKLTQARGRSASDNDPSAELDAPLETDTAADSSDSPTETSN